MPDPTIRELVYIASAAYKADGTELITELQKEKVGGWAVCQFRARKWFNDGFQGAILSRDDWMVCAFKGSMGSKSFVQDWLVNDLLLAINQMPPQINSAIEMCHAARKVARRFEINKPKIIAIGHSLGGGLAQLVGWTCGIPFLTFNGPGMLGCVGKGPVPGYPPYGIRGLNMIMGTDPVGNFGRHIGATERFWTPGALIPFKKGISVAHVMNSFKKYLQDHPRWGRLTLDEAIALAQRNK
jgi:hypothetical protein